MSDHRRPLGLGIIGCGNILAAYMTGLTRAAGVVRVARFSDVDLPRAEAAAAEHGVGRAGTLDELLADPEVEMVVSLTPPVIHDEVIVRAAAAGKHVFTEKPLSATVARARAAMAAADRAGVKVGCAPDTFLGPVHQATRAAIDAGEIGDPIGYNSFSCYRRAEERHPNPGFLFAPGGGPVLDLGPYYISTFVNLFGPIASVSAATRIGVPVRHAKRADGSILDIPVSVPTHASATLVHSSGVIGADEAPRPGDIRLRGDARIGPSRVVRWRPPPPGPRRWRLAPSAERPARYPPRPCPLPDDPRPGGRGPCRIAGRQAEPGQQ
jgi:predicted dehydrogenase